MKKLLLLLMLTACGSQPIKYCQTRCGLTITDPVDCVAFQEFEDQALSLYDQRGLFKYSESCSAMGGVNVEVIEKADAQHGRFKDFVTGKSVIGLANCPSGIIAVGNTRWHSKYNGLAHEMIHIIQNCKDGPNGEQHYQWFERGYVQAIDELSYQDF